jgi:predicted DNA-binding protein
MLTLRLEPKVEKLLERFAAKAGQTVDEFVRHAILERLEDCEDYEAGASALRASDGKEAVPFEEVMRSLGMEAEFPAKRAKTTRRPGQSRAKTNSQIPPRKVARVA